MNAAAWLIANGHRPQQVLPGTTVKFVFSDEGGAVSDLLERWRHDSVTITANVFLSAQKQVKYLIHTHQTTRNQAATVPGGTA
jgi:hypothetical protein